VDLGCLSKIPSNENGIVTHLDEAFREQNGLLATSTVDGGKVPGDDADFHERRR
jgi:hypothetical protein